MKIKLQTKKTNGTRHQICLQKNLLSKYNRLIKNLTNSSISKGGRNNTGRITIRHQGAGCKKSTHISNFDNKKYAGITICIFYDSKKTAFVSLNFDLKTKVFFKTISIKNVLPGAFICSLPLLNEYKLGYRSSIFELPNGSIVNSLNSPKSCQAQYARSAGSFCQILEKKADKIKIRFPSGKLCFLDNNILGSLGSVSNQEFKITKVGKAGKNRLKGIRPSVRGVAMNPVDHPHGGKSNKGKPPVTPWGLPTKNQPTVKKI